MSNDTKSQKDAILDHLRSGKSITPLEALALYGCFRLGARIYDLKHEGHDIVTDTEVKDNKSYASYRLLRPIRYEQSKLF
jgi:hypothetical protein